MDIGTSVSNIFYSLQAIPRDSELVIVTHSGQEIECLKKECSTSDRLYLIISGHGESVYLPYASIEGLTVRKPKQ